MPAAAARLVGFAALGGLGALEWQRLVGGLSSGRALLWLLAAVAAGAALVVCDRLGPGVRRGAALVAVTVAGALVSLLVSGVPARLAEPAHWGELTSAVGAGTISLGTVRLPYGAVDPDPRIALEVLGAGLLLVAALLALWPRRARTVPPGGGGGERGLPFLSLAVLLVLVVSPVVAIGGSRPVVLGVVLAALCIVFLWLERLPLRPGLGLAALVGVALAGALPLAATADRGAPWFDYKSFTEGLGPDDRVHFDWNQTYGPVDWPRDGDEVMRISSPKPLYWKAENLEDFNGVAWRERKPGEVRESTATDVPEDWRDRPAWTTTIHVEVRRMHSRDLIAAGDTMAVDDTSRDVVRSGLPGTYVVPGDLRRGDSYAATVHVPEPPPASIAHATVSARGQQVDDLVVDVPFRPDRVLPFKAVGRGGGGVVDRAVVHFRPFGDPRGAYAEYPAADVSSFDVRRVMRRSMYWRTYRLAMRLRRHAKTPLQYVLAVNRYLERGFTYSERPAPVPAGRAPLDGFLFDTKDGYCQHFSGAMALLLRMGGVPARVATGFSPGGYSPQQKAWIVRDTDAHAWVEVWYDSAGWVTYDPTPSETPARSQIFALDDSRQTVSSDSAPAVPRGGGPAGGGRSGTGLRKDLSHDPLAGSRATTGARGAGGGIPWWGWTLIALAAIASALAARVAWRRRRGPGTSADHAVAELEAALRRAGRPAAPGTTLRQLERILGGSPEAIGYLRAVSASRYGPAAAPPTVAQRRAMRRALASGLGMGGRLRAWWALPPRGL